MADYKEMDGLELPSLDSLDGDIDARFLDGGTDTGNEPEVGEVEYEFGDITAPMLSEMYGETVPAAPEKTAEPTKPAEEEKKSVSLAKPMMEDMTPAGGAPSSKPVSSPSPMSNTGNGYQSSSVNLQKSPDSGYQSTQGVYRNTSGSYSAPSYTYSSPSGGQSSSYWDGLSAANELAEKGRKKAKVLGIIIIALSVLDILSGGTRGLLGAALRIFGAYQFMKKASSGWRKYLCVVCVVSAIAGIINIIAVDSQLLPLLAAYDLGWIVSIVQFILVIYTIGMGVLSYFFIFDRSIKEYCRMP